MPRSSKLPTKVFLSWAGPRAGEVAKAFHKLLSHVIPDSAPFCSALDIEKGADWRGEIAAHLLAARVAVIFLTATHFERPWLNYEAGAIAIRSKKDPANKDPTRAMTFLLDGIEEAHLLQTPLEAFQHTKPERDDVFKMIGDIHTFLGASVSAEIMKDTFDWQWPHFKEVLDRIPPQPVEAPHFDRELALKEILVGVRALNLRDMERSAAAYFQPVGPDIRIPFTFTAPSAVNPLDIEHQRRLGLIRELDRDKAARDFHQGIEEKVHGEFLIHGDGEAKEDPDE